MDLREAVKLFVPPVVAKLVRRLEVSWAVEDGARATNIVPWSDTYWAYRMNLLKGILADDAVLGRFRRGEPLPSNYGVAVDERCVEYPWLWAHLEDGPETLLDAGSALNHDFILDNALLRNKRIHILTLAPESNCFYSKGISYLFADLRDIPIRDAYYDTVACISTLEHVGCDNSLYTCKSMYENRREDFVLAMRELARVLKPHGRLFLTVPFGVYRHFGFFQQFDRMLLRRAIDAFGMARQVSMTFYRYGREGWNIASEADCLECEYWSWISRPRSEWPDPLPPEPDLATGARAVACVKFIK